MSKPSQPTNADFKSLATTLDVDICAIKAIYQVEAAGDGFNPDGSPKILFEGHIFWSELKKRNIDPAGLLARDDVKELHGDLSDILYRAWTRKYDKGGMAEYTRLNRAKDIHEAAALCASSWGAFQIMGFHYKSLGYETVQDFVEDMKAGYVGQFKALAKFLNANGLTAHLRSHNWAKFARGYNGAGFAVNKYDQKLAAAYNKCANV